MDINYLPNEIKINRLGLSCILESRFGVNVLGAALKISVLKRGVVERRRNNVGYMGSTHGQKWSSLLVDADTVKSDLEQRQVV